MELYARADGRVSGAATVNKILHRGASSSLSDASRLDTPWWSEKRNEKNFGGLKLEASLEVTGKNSFSLSQTFMICSK